VTTVPLLPAAAPRFGRVLDRRVAGDFELRFSRYEGPAELPAHRHPDAYFCYVVAGGIDEQAGGHDRSFGPGSLHFHPAGDPHAGRTGHAGLCSLSIVLHGSATGEAGAGWTAPDAMPASLALRAARCWTAFHERDEAATLVLESAAVELVAAWREERVRPDARAPRWVSMVRERLHASFGSPVALRDLARLAGVHEVHVVRGFRKHLGATPGAYLRRLRIDAARRALLETDAAIVDVAFDAGFYDQSHFTREFRREVGLPPAAFRRLHASRPPRARARFRAS